MVQDGKVNSIEVKQVGTLFLLFNLIQLHYQIYFALPIAD